MAMKKFRRDVGGETWAQFDKGARKYCKKFWKKHCPWACRPRQCVKAFLIMTRDKSTKEKRLQNYRLQLYYNFLRETPKKRWQ